MLRRIQGEYLLYGVVFLPMLLISGLFWDDWVFYNQPERAPLLWELGRPYLDWLFAYGELLLEPVSLARWTLVVCYFATCIFAVKWVCNFIKIDNLEKKILFLFLSLIPLGFARTHNAILHYYLCLFCFTLSHFLIFKFMETTKAKITSYILPCFLLIVAFTTNSFLVLHFFCLFVYFLHFKKAESLAKSLFTFLKRKEVVLVILLPFIFFIFNKIFFTPFGGYANYNQIQLSSIPQALFQSFKYSLKTPFMVLQKYPVKQWEFWLLFFLFAAAIWCWMKKIKLTALKHKATRKTALITFIGLFCGLFPYLLVGVVPSVESWPSRHLMSSQLTIGFLFFVGISFLPKKCHKVVIVLLLAAFSSKNFYRYTEAVWDSYVQEATIKFFSESTEVENAEVIILNESNRPYLSIHRLSSFYEVTHFVDKAFPGGARFGINAITGRYTEDKREWARLVDKYRSNNKNYVNYNLAEKPEKYLKVFYETKKNPNLFQVYPFVVLRLFAKEQFYRDIRQIFSLRYREL